MRRALTPVLLLCLAAVGCQQYSSSMQKAVTGADETVVLSALRTLALAQQGYSVSNGGEYATMTQLVDGGYLDSRYKDGRMKGYLFTVKVTPGTAGQASFSCNADPEQQGEQAGRHFYVSSSSTEIHVNAKQPATATDETIH
jgi:hypothetical protein